MKKFLSMIICVIMVISIPISAFAGYRKDTIPPKRNSEFGTLTGEIQADPQTNYVMYGSYTTKNASQLRAYVDFRFYTTGKFINDDGTTGFNTTSASYYSETGQRYLSSKLSIFGTHEARGRSSLVGYTEIANF